MLEQSTIYCPRHTLCRLFSLPKDQTAFLSILTPCSQSTERRKYEETLLLIAALILPITVGFVFSQYTKNMQIGYSSKDLPEHGLIIVKPSDAEFDTLATILLAEQNIPDFEKIKPFSIFLKNNNSKAVVAHSIVWQFIDSDGIVISRVANYLNAPALTDGILDMETDKEYSESIAAGSYKFLTLAPKLYSQGGGGGSVESINKGDVLNTTQELSIEEKRSKAIDSLYSNVLKNKNEVVILLDGVFFEDGLFVGSDTTNFFNMVDTHVKAKRDIVSLVSDNLKNSVSINTLDKTLKIKSETKLKDSYNILNSEDQYDYSTKMFATYFLKLRQRLGKEGLVNEINEFRKKALPQIRKF